LIAVVVASAALAPACARPQWLLTVVTDAPVPTWGDRVLVELLDDTGALACADDCRHELPVDAASFPLTIGVVPAPDPSAPPPRVRVRFYRAAQARFDGLPQGTDLIDLLGDLPPLDGADTLAFAPLQGFCFGQPVDLAGRTSCGYASPDCFRMDPTGESCPDQRWPEHDFFDLAPDTLRPGNLGRYFSHCPAAAPPGMACLEATAFLLGSDDPVGVDTDYPTAPRVAVRPLFPLFIDRDEMTVGTVRGLVRGAQIQAPPSDLPAPTDRGYMQACTYLGDADATHDALPLNCISRDLAAQVCAALGESLPDEGQWELAASNGRGSRYPWGEDAPDCDRAIVSAAPACMRAGPVAGGSSRDVSDAGVRNLGGNLSEWVDGFLAPYTDPCWTSASAQMGGFESNGCVEDTRVLVGPWPHRGGSWDRRASSAASFARFASLDGAPSPSIGFRCAREAQLCLAAPDDPYCAK
jgi:formylglycine-generating enzyme required for sulfatase activity